MSNNCLKCGSDLVFVNMPKTLFEFTIPFTNKRFSIQLWDWENKEPQCLECVDSRKERYEERIFDAGYEKAMQDISERS